MDLHCVLQRGERRRQRQRQAHRKRPAHTDIYPHLPEGVELLPLGDGELPCLVLVDAIMQNFPFVQQAQRVGAIVVSGPDPGERTDRITPYSDLRTQETVL